MRSARSDPLGAPNPSCMFCAMGDYDARRQATPPQISVAQVIAATATRHDQQKAHCMPYAVLVRCFSSLRLGRRQKRGKQRATQQLPPHVHDMEVGPRIALEPSGPQRPERCLRGGVACLRSSQVASCTCAAVGALVLFVVCVRWRSPCPPPALC